MAYTEIDDPSVYFQIKLYTAADAYTFDGNSDMQPDWMWIKERNGTNEHNLFDSVRGTTKRLETSTTAAEQTSSTTLTAFGSDGFTVGNNPGTGQNGGNYVGWGWKAGTSFSNSAGANGANLASTGSVSTTAGFSIVSFTGNRDETRTVFHGLGAVPKMIIFKNRASTNGWTIYNETIGNAKKLTLNNTSAAGNCTACFASTTPTAAVFTVGDDGDTNGGGEAMIAYCFADVQGYSKVGSYVGNGNADGTFVYTGFKPAWIMFKQTNTTSNWTIYDTTRDTFNVMEDKIHPNTNGAESDFTGLDSLSNGFKFRTNEGTFNASGGSFIYMAFAEQPFVTGASAIPGTAG